MWNEGSTWWLVTPNTVDAQDNLQIGWIIAQDPLVQQVLRIDGAWEANELEIEGVPIDLEEASTRTTLVIQLTEPREHNEETLHTLIEAVSTVFVSYTAQDDYYIEGHGTGDLTPESIRNAIESEGGRAYANAVQTANMRGEPRSVPVESTGVLIRYQNDIQEGILGVTASEVLLRGWRHFLPDETIWEFYDQSGEYPEWLRHPGLMVQDVETPDSSDYDYYLEGPEGQDDTSDDEPDPAPDEEEEEWVLPPEEIDEQGWALPEPGEGNDDLMNWEPEEDGADPGDAPEEEEPFDEAFLEEWLDE